MPNPKDNQQMRLAAIAAMTLKDEEKLWEPNNRRTIVPYEIGTLGLVAGVNRPMPFPPIGKRPLEPIYVPSGTYDIGRVVTAAIGVPRHTGIEIITPQDPKESVFYKMHSSLHNSHNENKTVPFYHPNDYEYSCSIWGEIEDQGFSVYGTDALRYHDLLHPNFGDIDAFSNMKAVDDIRDWCLGGIDFSDLKKDNVGYAIRSLGIPDTPIEPPSIERLSLDFPEVTSRPSIEDLIPKKKSLEFDRTNTKLNRRYRRQQAKKS